MKRIIVGSEHAWQLLCEAVALPLPCGGHRRCGNCGVLVRGELSQPSEAEALLLKKYTTPPPKNFAWRLACCCKIFGSAEIILPDDTPETAGFQRDLPDYNGSAPNSYGIAVDIGTTTVTLALYRFPSKQPVSVITEMNQQSAFGADVLSRMQADFHALHRCIVNQLCDILSQTGVPPGAVTRAVFTGNTTMLHCLVELDPSSMGTYPFAPESLFGVVFTLDFLPNARIYLPPCASAFLGADLVCGAIALQIQHNVNTMLVDIGTNCEMILNANGRLLCCSAAAGPAFEGAEISMGMPALPGAIDNIWGSGDQLCWHAIPGASVRGICGTGLVGALRFFLERGTLQRDGAILPLEDDIYLSWQHDSEPELWLYDSEITITQDDVRKLQLAKAAVAAGISTLLRESYLFPNNITKLYLGGGFGSYLNCEDATAIGLLLPGLTAVPAGNTALQGATQLLFSSALRSAAEQLAKSIVEVPLTQNLNFQQAFLEYIDFPKQNGDA